MKRKPEPTNKRKPLEITYLQIILASDALGRLAKETKLGALASFRIGTLIAEIQAKAAPAHQARLAVHMKYGKEIRPGEYQIPPSDAAKLAAANKELDPLLKEKFTIHAKPIALSLLADKTETLSPEDMILLRPFIHDDLDADSNADSNANLNANS